MLNHSSPFPCHLCPQRLKAPKNNTAEPTQEFKVSRQQPALDMPTKLFKRARVVVLGMTYMNSTLYI